MRTRRFVLSALPLLAAMGITTSCTAPDISGFLQLQCESDSTLQTASQHIEMVPGQKISVGKRSLELTEKGRLKFDSSDKMELESGYIIGDLLSPYYKKRYRIETSLLDDRGKTLVEVSCDCRNPEKER